MTPIGSSPGRGKRSLGGGAPPLRACERISRAERSAHRTLNGQETDRTPCPHPLPPADGHCRGGHAGGGGRGFSEGGGRRRRPPSFPRVLPLSETGVGQPQGRGRGEGAACPDALVGVRPG